MEGLDAPADKCRVSIALINFSKATKATAHPVDCVYIAASIHDARYTRICVASVRFFYPTIPVRLLIGGPLRRGLENELHSYYDVEAADLPRGDYGWGFVKLEPLFGPSGERFLVMDSDTVFTGPVLNLWKQSDAPFLVDDEQQSDADTRRLYYDWEKVRSIDPMASPPRFVFNSGQWFGTAGVLTRDDFAPWLEWTMPRTLRHPKHFMPGDQGILNYVLNQKVVLHGLRVERRKIMRWPGHSMHGLDAERVSKRAAEPIVVHWAGMKKARHGRMVGADLLAHFEKEYYRRLSAGGVLRFYAGCADVSSQWLRGIRVWLELAFRNKVVPRLFGSAGTSPLNSPKKN
jgi:hypothetical protein